MTASPDHPGAHRLGHLLWEVSARTGQLGEAHLAGTPLTYPAIGLLDQIAAQPGVTIAEIARRSPKTQQAISQVAARLERLGYIERRVADGRSAALHLTEAGDAARTRGNAAEQEFEGRLRAALGADRYERLRALLDEARDVVVGLEEQGHG
ncbi:MAG TPA: MarR family winged helix-turn-helix transcriptional regulator [Solirubrobacteraceae bacterium]|nr:MarR family winged helix-turn-helix transcriptional regulator [Solirubrobacteraceae bacterium]